MSSVSESSTNSASSEVYEPAPCASVGERAFGAPWCETALLLAAYIALARRYCNDDLVDIEVQTLTGTTPMALGPSKSLRIAVAGDDTVSQLASRVGESAVDGLPGLADPPVSSDRTSGIRLSIPRPLKQALACGPSQVRSGAPAESAHLSFHRVGEKLVGRIEYATGTFDEALIGYFIDHLVRVLDASVQAPETTVRMLPVLGEKQRQQVLVTWNSTEREIPDASVTALFAEQVSRDPTAVALIHRGERVTAGELNERANQLGHYLRSRGVGEQALVGICMPQSVEAVVAVLGGLKVGGVYVPLNPNDPIERLREIIADAELTCVVTISAHAQRFADVPTVICVDSHADAIVAEPRFTPPCSTTADSAAYVLYTSGSTGKPKGVIGIHRSIINGLASVNYARDEVCCLNAFLTFGMSIANLFLPLLRGIPLVVLSDDELRDVTRMLAVVEREGITRIVLVPPVLRQVIALASGETSRMARVRAIGLVGTAVTPDLLAACAKVLPHVRFHNCYSSSEIGTLATVWDVDAEAIARRDPLIGRPVANTCIYILDEHLNPVPPGAEGEIYVAAPHLARGYLHHEALTEARFWRDPFDPAAVRRIYRTGDRGRFRASGEVEFLGRLDDQVKIRGFRIEPAEVIAHLEGHKAVKDAFVSVDKIGGDDRLVAYVVASAPGPPTIDELRRYLRERIPEYSVPSAFVYLDALPLTTNGKVDRDALPRANTERPHLEASLRPASTALEYALVEIWREVFGFQSIGLDDDFFVIGGDSLLAVQIAARIKESLGLELSLDVLLAHPTIAELAANIERANQSVLSCVPEPGDGHERSWRLPGEQV